MSFKARVAKWVQYLRGIMPIVLRFVPSLAGWSAVIYVAFDVVLWAIQSWPW